MRVRHASRMLPGVDDLAQNLVHTHAVLHLRKDNRTVTPHLLRVARHNAKVRLHGRREIGLVDDEQVTLCNARPALARDLVAARDVDYLDRVICKLTAIARCEIVAAGFDEQQFRVEQAVQFFKGHQVRRNVLSNRGVRTATRLDRANAFRRQRTVARQKFAILLGKNVVGHDADVSLVAQPQAELKHKRSLAAADRSADADGERASLEVAVERLVAFVKVTRMFERLVSVSAGAVMMMRAHAMKTIGSAGNSDNSSLC